MPRRCFCWIVFSFPEAPGKYKRFMALATAVLQQVIDLQAGVGDSERALGYEEPWEDK